MSYNSNTNIGGIHQGSFGVNQGDIGGKIQDHYGARDPVAVVTKGIAQEIEYTVTGKRDTEYIPRNEFDKNIDDKNLADAFETRRVERAASPKRSLKDKVNEKMAVVKEKMHKSNTDVHSTDVHRTDIERCDIVHPHRDHIGEEPHHKKTIKEKIHDNIYGIKAAFLGPKILESGRKHEEGFSNERSEFGREGEFINRPGYTYEHVDGPGYHREYEAVERPGYRREEEEIVVNQAGFRSEHDSYATADPSNPPKKTLKEKIHDNIYGMKAAVLGPKIFESERLNEEKELRKSLNREEKERRKEAKAHIKELKREEKEHHKEEKAHIKDLKSEVKEHHKEEMAHIKDLKREDKELHKEERAQEKELKREEKEHKKELKREEKEHKKEIKSEIKELHKEEKEHEKELKLHDKAHHQLVKSEIKELRSEEKELKQELKQSDEYLYDRPEFRREDAVYQTGGDYIERDVCPKRSLKEKVIDKVNDVKTNMSTSKTNNVYPYDSTYADRPVFSNRVDDLADKRFDYGQQERSEYQREFTDKSYGKNFEGQFNDGRIHETEEDYFGKNQTIGTTSKFQKFEEQTITKDQGFFENTSGGKPFAHKPEREGAFVDRGHPNPFADQY